MKSIMMSLGIVVLMTPLVFAQKKATAVQSQAKPVQAKRVPPRESDSSSAADSGESLETPNQRRKRLAAEGTAAPAPDQNPLAEAIRALQEPPPNPAAQRLTWSPPPQTGAKKSEVPKDYRPKTSPPPSATA